jgi:hypothetical protein
MPKKTCPQCKTTHGSRKKVCECGHDFGVKSNGKPSALYPEPGGWVLDKTRGMPSIDPPEPLPSGSIDLATLKHHVAYEGLGYCIYELIPSRKINDEKARSLWRKARQAMQAIVEYLDGYHLLQDA